MKQKVFISYSHTDEEYMIQLQNHISMLKKEGVIEEWHDRALTPGQEWDKEISESLISSTIIIMLISSDFLGSGYCYDIEMMKAMELHESKKAVVLPIIVRPCDWARTPFSKLQVLPKNAKPVKKWEDKDDAWLDVAKGLKKVIDSFVLPLTTSEIDQKKEYLYNKNIGNNFIIKKISTDVFLDLKKLNNPYLKFNDPTDDAKDVNAGLKVYCLFWLPRKEYIMGNILSYTPAIGICMTDPNVTLTQLIKNLSPTLIDRLSSVAPGQLTKEEREKILKVIGDYLEEDFITAVTFPDYMLKPGNKHPEIAYNVILDLFFVPLVEMNSEYSEQFHVRLSDIGGFPKNSFRQTKIILQAKYRKKGATSIEIIEKENSKKWEILSNVARIIAWSVSRYHNHDDERWVNLIRKSLDYENNKSSHMEDLL